MPKIISATQARKDFFKLLRSAGVPGHVVTINLNGSPPVMLVSAEEYEGWLETMDILSDTDETREILEAKSELDAGSVHPEDWKDVKCDLDL